MPRWASRLTLVVKGLRAERLQAITREDAAAEGICHLSRSEQHLATSKRITRNSYWPEQNYRELWEKINGLGSWDANPWVWVVEFEVVIKK